MPTGLISWVRLVLPWANHWSCCTKRGTTMSSPVSRDSLEPAMCVPIISNPTTLCDGTAVKWNWVVAPVLSPDVPSYCLSCGRRRKCVLCHKFDVGLKEISCCVFGYVDYPSCKEYTEVRTHRCFIQRPHTPQEVQEEKRKKKRKRQRQGRLRPKRGAEAGFQTLRSNE